MRARGQVVDDSAQRSEYRVRRRFGRRRGRRVADVVGGLADHDAHRGGVEVLEAAVGKRGKSAVTSATTCVRLETAIKAR
ncbi:hypothetical protein ACFYUJ_37680 [Streptomyces sp. NPDC004520]|uniref:hypothetical protein n=1 Tax=Streptomyces sp. NPDC004520 TaxID=3364702 RepID=UPI00369D4547